MAVKKATKKKASKAKGKSAGTSRGGLNARQAAFVAEYLVDLNATQAAIRAGYSAKTAYSIGQRLLKHVEVAKAIDEGNRKRAERTEITQDRVLQEIGRLAFLDIRKAFTEEGALKPMHELDDDTAAAIAGLDVLEMREDGETIGLVKKVKLSDKKGALELLARHLGMLNDKVKLQGDAENPLQMLMQQVSGTGFKPRAE